MEINGHSLHSIAEDSTNTDALLKQIETLKTVLHLKTVQLNMVIKTSDDKYADIHHRYRTMANELHKAWQNKYTSLQQENEKLMNYLALTSHSKSNTLSPVSFSGSADVSNLSNLSDLILRMENDISHKSNSDDEHHGDGTDCYID